MSVPSAADLSARLAQLSPEKRELLERALRRMASPAAAHIARRTDGGPAPLSHAQEFLWLIEQAYPGRAPYNVPRTFRVRGSLDVAALEGALSDLVERHAVLRTRFEHGPRGALQVVEPAQPIRIECVDASDDASLNAVLREHARRPFALTRDQLLRAMVVRIGADDAVLQLVVHHVTSDGWSRNVTLRDLGALYAARRGGTRATLESPAIEYADYAVWQRSEGERAATEDLRWWRAALEGAPAQLELPIDRPRTGVPGFEGARLSATIPRETLDALAELARRENASLFMLLLAAYGVLLHRHTGQSDLVIGSPVAGRTLAETHGVVGLFANTLALRIRCDGDPTFTELLSRVRAECLDAFEHQGLPFERLASELQRERGGADGTLVQTLFSLHDAAPEALVLDGASTEVLATEPGWSKVDLTIAAAQRADGLALLAEYRTDLFDQSTIERLVHHFGVLLGAIATNAHRAISELPLLDAAERAEIVRAGTGPRDTRVPECVHRMVEAAVAANPQAIAVVDERRTLTYAELDVEANRLARHLIAIGVRAGDAVAICLPRCGEMVVALLATLKAGAHYVPLDPEYPADRLAYILADSGAKVVMASRQTRGRVPASASTVVDFEDTADALAKLPRTRPDVKVGPEALAYVLHTSGSTGKPKGVMIPHRAVSNFLRSMAVRPGLAANDAVVAVTTLSFDIAGLELWLPLVVGARVVIAPRPVTVDGGALVRLVDKTANEVRARDGRVLLQATPATWRLMLDASWTGTEGLRMLCGGEAWSTDLAAPLLARGESLWNVYGPTETTIWSSVARVADAADVPLGEPLANTTLLVLDARRQPVPLGVAGELYIGGDGVALGYLGRADLTAERFVRDSFATGQSSRMYRTGDLVRRRGDGALEYLGRMDQQVKVRGFRIELGEVEAALARLDEVQQAVVVVRGTAGDARLVAYVVPSGDEEPSAAAMRAALRRSLPDYMVPAQYVAMRELPLTPNGKVDRRALPEPDAGSDAARPPLVAPRTPLEARIAEVWRDVLGVADVGVDDDFFALGGHSLLAMRVVARLASVLPNRLKITDLFEGRTVAALAGIAERAEGSAVAEERIVRAAERGSAPLSLAQQAVWTAEQRAPESAAYHAPMVTRVFGALDLDALQRAVDAVVARHESLRTTFEERGGEPVQLAHDGMRVRVELVDLRGTAREGIEQVLERAVREPFALSRGPLLRVRVLRVADEEWLVALVVHHLVFDGGSEPILLRELGEAYAAVRAGRTPSTTPNAIELADWARWEHAQVDGARLDGLLAYWRTTLAGAPAAIALPTDLPLGDQRDTRDAERAARVVAVFPPELYAAVTRLAREQDATPYMVLLAGFQALLSRFARQDDLVIGTPISRRDRAETQPLIGFLTNTLPLRATLTPETTFAGLVASVRERLLAAFANGSVAVERIAGELGGGALFDTLFVLQEEGEGGLHLDGCTTERWPVEIGAAKVDLSLSMTPTSAGLRAALIYRSARFQQETAERLLEHLGRLLAAASDAPTMRVADLPLLGDADRATLASWNDTRTPFDLEHTLHELITATAVRTPDAVAVEDERDSLTYEELDARTAHLAHALRELGIGPGKLVGICAERSVGMVVGLVGILRAGGAYVPIDPDYPADRVSYMLADSGVSVLLAPGHIAGSLPAHGAQLVLLDDPSLPWAHDDEPAPAIASAASPDDPAYMIYTSGSTGRPKGALNAHRGIVNRLAWMQQTFGLTAQDVVLQKTPMSFDVSVWEFFWPLMTGARLVLARPGGHRDPAYLAELIERAGVTVCHFVPSMLRAFVVAIEGRAQARGRPLRAVMASGEALAPDLVAAWYRAIPQAALHNLYGPTECAVDVSWWACPPSATPPAVVPIGRPIANTRLHVLDVQLREQPIGVAGELHIGGVQVGLGYHNRPDLTAERFVRDAFANGDGRLYKTGDLARWRTDGTIEYLGRLDFQVKLRGHRIELGEIEQVVASLDGVRGALALLHEDPALGARLVCYYVAPADGVAPDAVAAALRRALPEVMVPSAVVRLDEWPLSPNGKVDRRALPAPSAARDAEAEVESNNAVERVLARLMASTLGREQVGVSSDFFALGGHSLLATRVVTQASRMFRAPLTLRGFFAAPTVQGLAAAIAAAVGAERAERVATLAEQVQRMSPEERERLRAAQARMKQEVGIS